MPPRVVAAIQAPTLLNILSKSPAWKLEAADLGDAKGLDEASLLRVPRWDGRAEGVCMVLVCTPLHLENARSLFPKAKHVWCAHNGRKDILALPGSRLMHYLTFSHRNRAMVMAHVPEASVSVISPAYTPRRVWSWTNALSWTLRNRPKTRRPDVDTAIARILEDAGIDNHRVFGQDQPLGFATPEIRTTLLCRSSAYLSPLPPWAGFGLAEHEAMAAGCPLVGLRDWGDFMAEPYELLGLCKTTVEAANALALCRADKHYADAVGESGTAYVAARCTADRMDRSIVETIERVQNN